MFCTGRINRDIFGYQASQNCPLLAGEPDTAASHEGGKMCGKTECEGRPYRRENRLPYYVAVRGKT